MFKSGVNIEENFVKHMEGVKISIMDKHKKINKEIKDKLCVVKIDVSIHKNEIYNLSIYQSEEISALKFNEVIVKIENLKPFEVETLLKNIERLKNILNVLKANTYMSDSNVRKKGQNIKSNRYDVKRKALINSVYGAYNSNTNNRNSDDFNDTVSKYSIVVDRNLETVNKYILSNYPEMLL